MELIIIAGIVAAIILAFITFFLFRPGKLLHAKNWFNRTCLQGMTVCYCYSGSYRFCYSSRGKPGGPTPSVLMVHGFSATKDMWLPLIKHFPRNQHVVCLDLPGNGGTSRTGPEDYSIEGQVRRVHEFVQIIGLDKRPFHLVGTSMGGIIAGVYAAHYPTDLSSVTLICPGGLVSTTDTKFVHVLKEVEGGQQKLSIPLIPQNIQELEDMLKLCCYKPPKLNWLVLRGLLENRVCNNDFFKEEFAELAKEECSHKLQDNLHLITVPVQAIWGKDDQVVHVSGAAVLKAALPNCQVDLLDNCGHIVTWDQEEKAAKLLMDFVSMQKFNDGNTKKLS